MMFCLFLTICQTFKELSNPHETIFVPRADKTNPVTEDLLVGKSYITLPKVKRNVYLELNYKR